MGGTRAGEVASHLAVEAVLKSYGETDGETPLEDLAHAIEIANRVIHDQAQADPDLRGMGTTCTALVLREREGYLAHVGDSRAYVVRGGAIRQLTRRKNVRAKDGGAGVD